MSILVKRKNDQVFQLSLTELAFILIFLLLLLSGWMIGHEKDKRMESEKRLSKNENEYILKKNDLDRRESDLQQAIVEASEKNAIAEQVQQNAEKAIASLSVVAVSNNLNPEEIISNLRDCSKNQADSELLSKTIEDLQSQITALEKVRNIIESTDEDHQSDKIKKEIVSALSLKSEIEKKTNAPIEPGNESNLANACANAVESNKLATNLRGQLAFVNKQLQQSKNPKGFGLPPCWLDEAGKTQKLFDIEIGDAGLKVSPGWPAERAEDALKLPAVQEIISKTDPVTITEFRPGAQMILEWSRVQDPVCRHYAAVVVSASKVDAAVYGKNAVYDYFYPFGKEVLKK